MKIISWNLLRRVGATLDDLVSLIEAEKPDVLLMQEATQMVEHLPNRVGGECRRAPLPGRIHGPAIWTPSAMHSRPLTFDLPRGTHFDRHSLILDMGEFAVANVHLSHGQVLNRRQLRRLGRVLPDRAAVLGDYNLVGPALLPGFRDVGPRRATHMMAEMLPIRLDRCLVRGLVCTEAAVLPRGRSDHRPIMVRLEIA